jgi:hypothetical protein
MSFNEWGIIIAAIGVVFGVILEGWEHWHAFKTKGWKPLVPKIGFALLFVSLTVEIVFDARLAKESADTQLQAARIEKEFSARHLTAEQEAEIAAALKPFAGQSLNVAVDRGNIEAWVIADEIERALGKFGDMAQWKVQFATVMEYNRALSGMLVEIPEHASDRTKKAATALISALQAAGLACDGPEPEWKALKYDGWGDPFNATGLRLTVGMNLGGPVHAIPAGLGTR